MEGGILYKEVVPFTAMVILEVANVGVNTLFKAATTKGMSYLVFIVYSYVISAMILLPSSLILHRKIVLPPLNYGIMGKFFALGLIGAICLLFGYKGIEYASPTLASAMSNLIPAFTFIFAIIFRMEKLYWRSSSGQAKIIGTIVSITGALLIILYKGPSIMSMSSKSSMNHYKLLHSSNSKWIIGGVLLGTDYILTPVWYVMQGIFEALCCGVRIWIMRRKGPFYVAMFKPLSIAIAAAMGVILLGDTLYLGSIIGAIAMSLGFYTLMWGKITEEESYEELGYTDSKASSYKVPLLQNSKVGNS